MSMRDLECPVTDDTMIKWRPQLICQEREITAHPTRINFELHCLGNVAC